MALLWRTRRSCTWRPRGHAALRPRRRTRWACAPLILMFALAKPSLAGPPYITDDPEPTEYKHFEIYVFGTGTAVEGGNAGKGGLDFNYGVAPDTQLTVVLPGAYDKAAGAKTATGLGNMELAVKYRFLHQETSGWDVSFFPRVFLPSASNTVGEQHASLLLPIWLEKDWGEWSTFGGGGCTIDHGGQSRNFCLAGWAVTRQVLPDLQLGVEIYHQTPDSLSTRATTGVGLAARYDVSEHLHLIGSIGPGIQNAADTNQYSWYAAVLTTF
jgi:Putative MetA-pathway of phenol degradation